MKPDLAPAAAAALGARALLRTWDDAQALPPWQRADALLQLAWPEVPPATWGTLPLGARDERLFQLYEALFGPVLELMADCPACDEPLELSLHTHELWPEWAAPSGSIADAPTTWQADGYEVAYRLPGVADLAAAMSEGDAAVTLLERCVLDARHGGRALRASELPPAVIDVIQQDMARRDPAADLRIALACPACGHSFERRLDIAACLWAELDDWAGRTLAEVHVLARAYGWTEGESLSLSASRRQRYIDLIGAGGPP